MIQDVFIIGATGNVGSALVRQIFGKGDTSGELHANPTRVVGLASSRNYMYLPTGIGEHEAFSFVKRDSSHVRRYSLRDLLDAVKESAPIIFVDVTAAGEEMTKFHLDVMQNTPHGIVTANKNPVASSDYKTFKILTANPKKYGYRCSVMAGADAIPFLRDSIDLNDKIRRIEGCLSGTNMYIASQGEKRKISDVVRGSMKLGYTEPDPRDDLNGFDVARKLVVLARTAGFDVNLNDVDLKPFVPQEFFEDESVEDFLTRLEGYNNDFANLVKSANQQGNVLRYIAAMSVENGKPKLECSLNDVPARSQLGMLTGRTNKVIITTEHYPQDNPYIVEGPGAGLDVTARNIRRDLLDMLPARLSANRTIF